MTRIKFTQLKSFRENMLAEQGNLCGMCKLPITNSDAVLDHDHKTGFIRGVAHRGCNSLAGKLENNAPRYKVNLNAFLSNIQSYLSIQTTFVHPTHKNRRKTR